MSVVLQVIQGDQGDQVDLKDLQYPEGGKEPVWILTIYSWCKSIDQHEGYQYWRLHFACAEFKKRQQRLSITFSAVIIGSVLLQHSQFLVYRLILFTHSVSFGTVWSRRTRKTPVTFFSLFTWGSDKTNKTWMALRSREQHTHVINTTLNNTPSQALAI